ncbi:MAG: 4Fe-4S dicluster domain-containing protein [Deltaproteobacteria bacterium]|nr:MAG: 4Fe-4S dicluster domain-containing protein [Deltaproteobacteria bacterium]
MAGLNRRDFLKALGIGSSASVMAACRLDDNRYYTPIEQVLPYVVKPEQITPGTPTFFATSVGTGPNAHTVLARHRDGRVINVGANRRSPMAGIVPTDALFELQRHFSPDRYQAPAKKGGEATDWDAARSELVAGIKAAKSGGKKVAWLGPYASGSIVKLLDDVTDGNAVYWEPLGYEADALAAEKVFGKRVLPGYDLAKAKYIVSFGADFLSGWGGWELANQYAKAKDPNEGGFVARFALVSPYQDQTGANADDWYQCKPGAQAQVALAVAKLVAAKKGYNGPAARLVAAGDPAAAAAASGLGEGDIDAIAAQIVSRDSVVLPGGASGATTAATELAMACFLINVVSGMAGKTFGLGTAYTGPVHSYGDVKALIDAMNAGSIGALLLGDVNPAYALPADSGFAEAVGKVPFVASFSSHPDETNALANVILPVADVFEDWGDEEVHAGLRLLRQPAQSPMYGALSLGDVLLAAARDAGLQAAAAAPVEGEVEGEATEAPAEGEEAAPAVAGPIGFTPATFREYVKAVWKAEYSGANFDQWFSERLADGFMHHDTAIGAAPISAGAPALAGTAAIEGEGEYFLHAYPHPFRKDGRFANQPWAQETPDPMTGMVWDSWVCVNPKTAERMGWSRNDLLELKTAAGSIQVGVEFYPGVREDVLAVAFGQGHAANGRYANGVGANVVSLLSAKADSFGALAWQQAKVAFNKVGTAELVTTIGSDTDQMRMMAPIADADTLAKVGDAESAHPGEMTGIHHLPLDARLHERGAVDFYGMTDHPTYRWGMTVDINACTGCGACSVACYAENNLPVVGKAKVRDGREMGWIRVNRYWGYDEAKPGLPVENRFLPMMCQQCAHAPCESVCPVLATYHTIDGLNAMVYNRCVGTRYCANNCPYIARRFNYHSYVWPEPFNLQLNPDVVTRTMGVMEKCTFCVQRLRSTKSAYRDQGIDRVPDEALEQITACAEACPTDAISFGNLVDPESGVTKHTKSGRAYQVFAELNTMSAVTYLAKASYHRAEDPHHGGGHGEEHGEAGGEHHEPEAHGDAHGGEHAEPAPKAEGAHHEEPAHGADH